MKSLKIAIVYDWLDKWGGIERVLLTLHELFPDAVFFSSHHDPEKTPWTKGFNIKTSFMQNLPHFIKKSRLLSLPFYPFAFESFDFSEFDFVLSVSSSFAKGIITKPATLHICYLLTPTRFLWVSPDLYLNNFLLKILSYPYYKMARLWDRVASKRPDHYIAISQTVSKRLKKYYNQDCKIIYPPFDIDYWKKIKLQTPTRESYYLVVSRLEPYKRIDLAVDVFNQTGKDLIIVGTGSQEKKLKQSAKKNIKFMRDVSDTMLATLYQNAAAFIMPQEEDFGLASLEAQFFGCPVIAFKKGGALETIIMDKTGIFFDKQTATSLIEAIEKFEKLSYTLKQNTKRWGVKQVEKFSKQKFTNSLSNLSYLRNLKSNI